MTRCLVFHLLMQTVLVPIHYVGDNISRKIFAPACAMSPAKLHKHDAYASWFGFSARAQYNTAVPSTARGYAHRDMSAKFSPAAMKFLQRCTAASSSKVQPNDIVSGTLVVCIGSAMRKRWQLSWVSITSYFLASSS